MIVWVNQGVLNQRAKIIGSSGTKIWIRLCGTGVDKIVDVCGVEIIRGHSQMWVNNAKSRVCPTCRANKRQSHSCGDDGKRETGRDESTLVT